MSERSDVVVVGAGHNGLISAAYLARAGLSVTVLEANAVPGGGATTGEATLPGFRHDLASSLHSLIQFNPVLAADELGLIAEHGLRYERPEPVMAVFADRSEPILFHADPHRTAAEIARYSESDAESFLGLIAEWEAVLPSFVRRLSRAPGPAPGEPPEATAKLAEFFATSGDQIIIDRFSDDRTRTLMLSPGAHDATAYPGTGLLPVHWAGLLGRVSWAHPVGGAGALTDALVAAILAAGGQVLCERPIERILVEGGRAGAVLTADGERFEAAKAVLSSAYVAELPRLLGDVKLPSEFDRLAGWRPGAATFVVHLALERIPEHDTPIGQIGCAVTALGTAAGIATQRHDIAAGRLSGRDRWTMAMCPSVVDPSRAPAGKATGKLLTMAPYALEGDPANWESRKQAYAEEVIESYAETVEGFELAGEGAVAVRTPLDIERMNRNFVAGGFLGGELAPDQAGPNRPVPGWSAYRMPVEGLYLTGGGTFPGGGIAGWPGRNAAAAMLDDLGIGTEGLMNEAGRPDTLPRPETTTR
jgi:phytoene dehydrogenase-like protein